MGNALGIQTWDLGINPQSQKKEKFFTCLIVSDDLIKHSYLVHDDQFTILKKKTPLTMFRQLKILETDRQRELTSSKNS